VKNSSTKDDPRWETRFPCPFQPCGKRFCISLGKNMTKHLERSHNCYLARGGGVDPQLPPEVRAALAALREQAGLQLAVKKARFVSNIECKKGKSGKIFGGWLVTWAKSPIVTFT
jgi:hypothetical protein